MLLELLLELFCECPGRGGDFGLNASISEVIGTTGLPLEASLMPSCHVCSTQRFARPPSSPSTCRAPDAGRCSSCPGARTVTHPLRSEESFPDTSRRRVPRQKFSIKVYISGGLRVGSSGSPSQMMTSVSAKMCQNRYIG